MMNNEWLRQWPWKYYWFIRVSLACLCRESTSSGFLTSHETKYGSSAYHLNYYLLPWIIYGFRVGGYWVVSDSVMVGRLVICFTPCYFIIPIYLLHNTKTFFGPGFNMSGVFTTYRCWFPIATGSIEFAMPLPIALKYRFSYRLLWV